MSPWIIFWSCEEIPGTKKRSTGPMIKDVFSAENVSVDIQKMRPIQEITGSQKCVNRFNAICSFIVLSCPKYDRYNVSNAVQASRRF